MNSGKKNMNLIEYILVNHRWIFVLFLLPVSFFYDIYFYLRNAIVFKMSSAPRNHKKKVENVSKQVEHWMEMGQKTKMCTARPGWQTISPQNMAYKNRMHQISINLVDILEVDAKNKTITCEPLVTMGQITRTLDKLGWTLPILPELDDLTVGGLVMGTGIETSSHKYGLFQHICLEYELVLADGRIIKCSEKENSDLFYAVPWSYGTLGFLTSVKIRIISSKRFVKMTYTPMRSWNDCQEALTAEIAKENAAEFIEALVYDEKNSVLMTGDMVDSCEIDKLNEIGLWYKPWFFKHVEAILKIGQQTEYIPLRDYYHRHSRSIFWEIQDIIPFGNNWIFRYLFGWLVPPKVSLLKLTQGPTIKKLYEENHMIQDMLVPMEDLSESLSHFEKSVKIYPIWICPFKLPANPGMLKTQRPDTEEIFVDIGVYGVPKVQGFNARETTRSVEEFVRQKKGFQMMYADSYMTRAEFESMFDHTLYREMRIKYDCEKAFPEVYDKVNKKARSSSGGSANSSTETTSNGLKAKKDD